MKADINKSMTKEAESLHAYVNRARVRGGRSLVPRPSHLPFFYCLQYANTEGVVLVNFIT